MGIACEPQKRPPAPGDHRRGGLRWGVAIAAAWLVVAVLVLPRYGPTVDESAGEIPYGEGLLHWLESSDVTLERTLDHPVAPPVREPHPRFVFDQPWTDVWPVASFLSALSCRLCWTKAGWLGAIEAHHLPAPLFVAALVIAMVAWLSRRIGVVAGVGAALCMLAAPRFFADAISNLKDAPEAALYVLAWLAVPRALERATLRGWALAAVLAAAALAQKANALFLAPQGLLWLLVAARAPRQTGALPRRPLWLALLFALLVFAAVYFALSPQLWIDPVDHVARMYRHVLENGNRVTQHALQGVDGAIAGGTAATISCEGLALVAWTTPPAILLLALVGLFSRRLALRDRLFLVIGVAVPVGRSLIPGNVNFDGVRHYLEFMPCLALLAGAGIDVVGRALVRPIGAVRVRTAALARAAAMVALVAPGAVAVVRTHPNGVAYFNGLVGGLAGAQERGVPDATDYWGNSYWQALDWLNGHAEPDAAIHVALFPAVVRSVAHYRLRPDLKLARLGKTPPRGPLYVMYVTRRSWYDRALREVERDRPKVHQIRVDGAPILSIVRFEAGEETRDALLRFTRSVTGANLLTHIAVWSQRDGGLRDELAGIVARRPLDGEDETLARLRRLLPPELQEGLADFLWETDPAATGR